MQTSCYKELSHTILKCCHTVDQGGGAPLHRHCKHVELVGVIRVQVSYGEGGMGLCLVGKVGSSDYLLGHDDIVSDDSILQCVLRRKPRQGEGGGGDVGGDYVYWSTLRSCMGEKKHLC